MEALTLEQKLRRECAAMRISRNQHRTDYIELALKVIPEHKRRLIPSDYDDDQKAQYIKENLETLLK